MVDALTEQVQRQRDEVDVAGPLAVSEQTALDPLGARHHPELRRGDGGSPVVAVVHAEHDRIAPVDVAMESSR